MLVSLQPLAEETMGQSPSLTHINTYTAERDDVDDTLFPHGSTMPAGAGQPPVIGEIVKLREPLFEPSGSSARREAAR